MCWLAVLEPLHPGWHLCCRWRGTAGLLLKHANAQHLPKELLRSSLLCSPSSPGPVLVVVKFSECRHPLPGVEEKLLNELLPPSQEHTPQRQHWVKSSTLYNHTLPCWPFQMLISYFFANKHSLFYIYATASSTSSWGWCTAMNSTECWATSSHWMNQILPWQWSSVLEDPFNPELKGAPPSYSNLPCSVETQAGGGFWSFPLITY